MLGHKLVQVLGKRFDVWATVRTEYSRLAAQNIFNSRRVIENLDVENIGELGKAVSRLQPAVIINAVGIVKQLPAADDMIKTLTVNAVFPHRLYQIAQNNGARLINISTDCVFDGKKGNYTETDAADATDVYGKSKFLGETISENAVTLRTSIIGRELSSSHSLVEWFLASQGGIVEGYTKAIFSGFPTLILAEIIADLIEHHPQVQGLYHVSSEPISKYDLLNLLNAAYRARVEIKPAGNYAIDRSLDSSKFRAVTGFVPLDWAAMVDRMAADNSSYSNINIK